MRNVAILFRRELASYFATPLALVFIVIFLVLAGALAFYLGGFYERGQADLAPFFNFHPWLYLFLIPALSMRLWAEERKSGSIELLMTLPVTPWQAVLGKFLAAWCVAALALALTFPIWITVNYLGDPDNGAILAAYVGSLLMAGGFLAIGSCLSAATRNQVIAFILTAVGVLRVPAGRFSAGPVARHRLGAAAAHRRGRLTLVSDAFLGDLEGCDRPARSGVLCLADCGLARGNRDRARHEESGLRPC
jgi:ABC-type transport system involved in multi-copper enzyme maturation permease subunit